MHNSSEGHTDAMVIETLYEQVRKLEVMVIKQSEEVTDLKIALSKKYEADTVLKDYIDSMPFPAWIKTVGAISDGSDTFKMWYINEEYERLFDVREERYRGKTDFDIWPKDVAETFYKNDSKVLETLGASCGTEVFPTKALEPVSDENPLVVGLACKWAAEVAGGRAIAGQIIELK